MSDNPSWARGYDVADLKAITAMVSAHEAGMIHGAFGRLNERDVATGLADGSIRLGGSSGEVVWMIASRELARPLPIRDFTGEVRLTLPVGSRYVSRIAWADGWDRWMLSELDALGPAALQLWQELPAQRRLAGFLGLELGAVKISAASELRGLYVLPELKPEPYPRSQEIGLARLPVELPQLGELLEQLAYLGAYAKHYSAYNARGSWTALSLRGFYDEPERIEKPSEMSRSWKAEHPDDLSREVRDTPLREKLPAVEAILDALPGAAFERIRLMALAPGGGELTRHADITDPDAGAAPGKLVRLHVPIITNRHVSFSGWDLFGQLRSGRMPRGTVCYLDTRKPHTAYNGGESQRIHLVADVVANAETVELLAAGDEFPVQA